jgi:hypothetical protein
VGWSASSLRETPLSWRTGRGVRVRHLRWPASNDAHWGKRSDARRRCDTRSLPAALDTLDPDRLRETEARRGSSYRDLMLRGAIDVAVAPGRTMLR